MLFLGGDTELFKKNLYFLWRTFLLLMPLYFDFGSDAIPSWHVLAPVWCFTVSSDPNFFFLHHPHSTVATAELLIARESHPLAQIYRSHCFAPHLQTLRLILFFLFEYFLDGLLGRQNLVKLARCLLASLRRAARLP